MGDPSKYDKADSAKDLKYCAVIREILRQAQDDVLIKNNLVNKSDFQITSFTLKNYGLPTFFLTQDQRCIIIHRLASNFGW